MSTYVETFRAAVAPADCDLVGHMNVQPYFRVVSEGMFVAMVRLGLTPEEILRRKLSFAVVPAETDFPSSNSIPIEVCYERCRRI